MNETHVARIQELYPTVETNVIRSIVHSVNQSIARTEERMTVLSRDFQSQKAILFPSFLPVSLAEVVGNVLLADASRFEEIKASKHKAKWSLSMLDETLTPFEQDAGQDFLSAIMLSSNVSAMVCRIAGITLSQLLTTKRWINRYYAGEFITPHRDTTGDFQTILCLLAPPPSHGGAVFLSDIGSFELTAGDLLMFSASTIEHWTSPLESSDSVPAPMRLTGICRYYIKGGKEPHSQRAIYDTEGNVVGYQSGSA